ncbi:unnamed protein product [Protopolystoma xenopodis]|uniref:Uncharacterized protein n=1 Tax=Protopolystoma xenopodis TaxID=117903 RepID=A0A3S4ZYY7_9PLAT|nr:unnamed protein product [Protopolystoma xenopodis]
MGLQDANITAGSSLSGLTLTGSTPQGAVLATAKGALANRNRRRITRKGDRIRKGKRGDGEEVSGAGADENECEITEENGEGEGYGIISELTECPEETEEMETSDLPEGWEKDEAARIAWASSTGFMGALRALLRARVVQARLLKRLTSPNNTAVTVGSGLRVGSASTSRYGSAISDTWLHGILSPFDNSQASLNTVTVMAFELRVMARYLMIVFICD